MDLKQAIRTIPDFPKPGIQYRDITTLLGDAAAFRESIRQFEEIYQDEGVQKIAGIDARGFIFGAALADRLNVGLVPLRKPGKLPYETHSETYALEYGEDALHLHVDAVSAGERVILIDDLIATGGTARAGVNLLRKAGAEIIGAGFVIDLPDLGGAEALRQLDVKVSALVSFEGH